MNHSLNANASLQFNINNQNDKLKQVSEYVHSGWALIPLHTPTKNRCSCGNLDCSSPGKHPKRLFAESYFFLRGD